MYDLNFLHVVADKKKKSSMVGVLIALSVLVVIGIAVFYIYMNFSMKEIENETLRLQNYIASDEVRVKYEELNQLRSVLDGYRKHNEDINKIDGFLLASDYMNGAVLDKIMDAAPAEVEYSSINFNGRFIDVQATAADEVDAAEWLHRIKLVDQVESAQISTMSIDDESGKATVSLSCILQEVIG